MNDYGFEEQLKVLYDLDELFLFREQDKRDEQFSNTVELIDSDKREISAKEKDVLEDNNEDNAVCLSLDCYVEKAKENENHTLGSRR